MTGVPAGAVTVSSSDANRSRVGAGSGEKIGIRCSSSRWAGTRDSASMRTSCLQVSAARIGRNGSRNHQRPAGPDQVDQHRGQCGTRARSFRPGSSAAHRTRGQARPAGRCAGAGSGRRRRRACCRARPRARATSATQLSRPDSDRDQRRSPEHDPEPEIGGEPLAPDQREGGECPDDAADPHRGVQQADRRIASVQEVESGDDYKDAECAREERLRRVEADHDAKAAVVGDRPETAGGLAQEAAFRLILVLTLARGSRQGGSARRAPLPRRRRPP